MNGPIQLHWDKHGYADAIDEHDGRCLLHLNPGTECNVRNAQAFVDEFNTMCSVLEEARLRIENLKRAIFEYAPDVFELQAERLPTTSLEVEVEEWRQAAEREKPV